MFNSNMKNLMNYINEQVNTPGFPGSTFKEEVQYTNADWEKWKKNRPNEIYVGTDAAYEGLEVVYMVNHKTKTVDHIASYDPQKQVLFCDDITLFGHEVK